MLQILAVICGLVSSLIDYLQKLARFYEPIKTTNLYLDTTIIRNRCQLSRRH